MAVLKPLELTKEERSELEVLARSRRDWRTRDRSRTILMFSNGVPAKQLVARFRVENTWAHNDASPCDFRGGMW